ncbi:TetR/AcrR family transcriptional regulator [Mycobacterium sp.]|jgi:AcrR family transcriptional regulator|uniref:TetR/AcrR family transcriptional regulator n=1 Tax=Mycobacterium sp. TaxID=1785 RepID=UPI00334252D5|nr:TetR family transcriptional regulator [Mycobacterium sp.]
MRNVERTLTRKAVGASSKVKKQARKATMDVGSRRSQRQRAARPSKGEIREAQILDVTERLLRTTPFVDITMDEIATRAGLSRSTMYFYFASKEDLLAGLLARTHDEIVGPTATLLNAGTTVDRAVRQVLEALLRSWRKHGPALRTFLETGLVSTEFGPRWRPTTNEIIDVVTQFIDRERAAGRLPAGPPSAHAVSSAVFWMVEHEMYELFRTRHTRAAEAELIETLALLWQRAMGAT